MQKYPVATSYECLYFSLAAVDNTYSMSSKQHNKELRQLTLTRKSTLRKVFGTDEEGEMLKMCKHSLLSWHVCVLYNYIV